MRQAKKRASYHNIEQALSVRNMDVSGPSRELQLYVAVYGQELRDGIKFVTFFGTCVTLLLYAWATRSGGNTSVESKILASVGMSGLIGLVGLAVAAIQRQLREVNNLFTLVGPVVGEAGQSGRVMTHAPETLPAGSDPRTGRELPGEGWGCSSVLRRRDPILWMPFLVLGVVEGFIIVALWL